MRNKKKKKNPISECLLHYDHLQKATIVTFHEQHRSYQSYKKNIYRRLNIAKIKDLFKEVNE